MNHNTLQEFLDTAQIPEFKSTPKTFLEIAKQPHYENVISNIYAFFLDPSEEHGLEDLFINSLIKCLNEKKGSIWIEDFSEFEIHTEYSIKGGRIDILLLSAESAIIIENKIYHQLTNSLRNYSNKIGKEIGNQSSVYGLVLGLKEIKTNEDNFVSLTHKELLQQVFEDLGAYMLNASDKYLTFLKDFYQNILNLSHKTMKQEDVEFYFKNQEKINDIIQLEKNYKKYIRDQVNRVNSSFEDLKLEEVRKNSEMYNLGRRFNSKVPKLCIKVGFSRLFKKEQQIKLYIEVRRQTLKLVKENFDEITKTLPDNFKLDEKVKNTSKTWYNLYEQAIDLNHKDILNLSDFIADKIRDLGIYKAFKDIEDKLHPLKEDKV